MPTNNLLPGAARIIRSWDTLSGRPRDRDHFTKNATRWLVSAGLCIVMASPVMAQSAPAGDARERNLAMRLQKLEADAAAMRAELSALHSANGSGGSDAATSTAAAATPPPAASANTVPAARAGATGGQATAAADTAARPLLGFRSGNSTVTLNGYVKLIGSTARYSGGEVATNTLGRDFYLPQFVPVGQGPASRVTDISAKQTRFWVDASTRVGDHALKAYIEFDFQAAFGTQGSQRTTNAYDLALRRAFVQLDRWTIGQEFTNFSYVPAFPESTDYVGGVDGLVFVREPQIRYTAPLSKRLTLNLSVENPESATSTVGSPALIENGDDHLPDFTARLVYAAPFGEISLAGIARQLRTANAGTVADRAGYGGSLAGKIYLDAARRADIRFVATYGTGIGRYLGLNFGPDTVSSAGLDRLSRVDNLALYGAAHIPIKGTLRTNLIGSFQRIYYSDFTPLQLATFNRQAWSVAGNLFYSPIPNVDLGVEFRHGERQLVSRATGTVNRLDLAVKYSF